jgi:hypothetical protein
MPNHLDIAPRYADVLMGITNTAGTVPGHHWRLYYRLAGRQYRELQFRLRIVRCGGSVRRCRMAVFSAPPNASSTEAGWRLARASVLHFLLTRRRARAIPEQ